MLHSQIGYWNGWSVSSYRLYLSDAAQREIDSLRSEVSKLKSDKMDLVRQNVVSKEAVQLSYYYQFLYRVIIINFNFFSLIPTSINSVSHLFSFTG